ncbi:MAG: outer membrane protein assembly factor BamE [Pseudomonadota bacterium]|nr:MAG: outer membrane protein assembly factor BamE [Pseudomonadota bacterium]
MRNILTILMLGGLALGGCSVYRIDVQQGNVLEADQTTQIRPGMSKQQVVFIMGTPMIRDPFHKDRWDYIYTLTPGSRRAKPENYYLTLIFEGDTLASIERKNVPETTQ